MKESKILLFAGTTEGRELAEYLVERKVKVQACVATPYGESLLPKNRLCLLYTSDAADDLIV